MSFMRPEAKAQLIKWREVIAGTGALLLGAWWFWGSSQVLLLPSLGLVVLGGALVWVGIQRARFRSAGEGPGSVQVDEGQITYFGPLTGGAVALRELSSITLDPTLHPAHWRLRQADLPELLIPVNAEGAEGLFDAFATLPRLRMAQALAALKTPDKHPIVIWQRDATTPAQRTLH